MTRKDIDHIGWQYRKQALIIVGFLFLAGLLAVNIGFWKALIMPLIFCAVYAWALETGEALVWARVAKSAPESLPHFFMGVSGVRMFSALAVMFVYYLTVGHGSMVTFFGVFAVFYVAILVHHIVFFRKHADISIDE